jgi:hypothetical protein
VVGGCIYNEGKVKIKDTVLPGTRHVGTKEEITTLF